MKELYDAAMGVKNQAEADVLFKALVAEAIRLSPQLWQREAERIQRLNLGYWAGYYGNETRERVERLFKCEHPVFGKIAEKGPPTPEQAFKAGVEAGKRMKEKGLI